MPILEEIETFNNPYDFEDMKRIMEQLEKEYLEGDKVYLYYDAQYAFRYYLPFYDLTGIDEIIGIKSRENPQEYIEDVKPLFKYSRVWFIFSHGYRGLEGDEEDIYLEYLKTNGTLLEEFHYVGSAAYLFEFP